MELAVAQGCCLSYLMGNASLLKSIFFTSNLELAYKLQKRFLNGFGNVSMQTFQQISKVQMTKDTGSQTEWKYKR